RHRAMPADIIGATGEGRKELVGLTDGVRESAQSWRKLLLDLKRRGCRLAPSSRSPMARSDSGKQSKRYGPRRAASAAGCTKPPTSSTNCRTASSRKPSARCRKSGWPRPRKIAFDAFIETWGVKYDKAVECLTKDRDALLGFYDSPAEHWKHLRTTNVIESSFATVRHRTVRSKGCLSNKSALAMIFKLAEAAEKSWRRLNGHNQLPKIILGIKFTDGIEVVRSQAQTAAA